MRWASRSISRSMAASIRRRRVSASGPAPTHWSRARRSSPAVPTNTPATSRPFDHKDAIMTDIILHHYAGSPFAEKVRIALAIKQTAWKSVDIPNVMPKPDLMPLTGGYRKTPVLQIGADIYCDTQLMMLEIEKHSPEKPLLPVGQEGEARAIAMWIDRNIFWAAVGVVMGAIGDKLPESFQKDRSEFSGRSFDP